MPRMQRPRRVHHPWPGRERALRMSRLTSSWYSMSGWVRAPRRCDSVIVAMVDSVRGRGHFVEGDLLEVGDAGLGVQQLIQHPVRPFVFDHPGDGRVRVAEITEDDRLRSATLLTRRQDLSVGDGASLEHRRVLRLPHA